MKFEARKNKLVTSDLYRKKSYIFVSWVQFMTEGSSDAFRPNTIIIRGPELEEAEEEVALDHEGIPPPVKAVTPEVAPHTPGSGHLQFRIGVSLLAIFMLSFLFLDLVPEAEREAVGMFAAFSLVFGMFFLVLGASKGQPGKSRPKTVVIANQPIEDKKAESSSAALNARSDNPWIDDGGETHSFWAGMLGEQTEPEAAAAKQTKKEIPVSSDAHLFSIMYLICFLPVALLCIMIGGLEACGAVLFCCMPELLLIALFDNSTTKSSPQEVHQQGLNALLVVGFIAICLLMIIAFA
jgi:hypothetical protein